MSEFLANLKVPSVVLPPELNFFWGEKVEIRLTLYENIKVIPVWKMLDELRGEGRLPKRTTVIEATSGNTGLAIKTLAQEFDLGRIIVVVSPSTPLGKVKMLEERGIEVIQSKKGMLEAREQCEQHPGWVSLNQYGNLQNPMAHFKWTGPKLWKATEGRMTIYAGCFGTGGTSIGVGDYLRRQNPQIHRVGVVSREEQYNTVFGSRTFKRLEEVSLPWKNGADCWQEIGLEEALTRSYQLIQAGLPVGPSTGLTLAGLDYQLKDMIKSGKIDQYRGSDGWVVAGLISPDQSHLYPDLYYDILGVHLS